MKLIKLMTPMKRGCHLGIVVSIVLGVAGCGDSWNSLNQMEKNVQNEAADILSKVQDEASAKFAVLEATEKVKNKWEGVKKRKDKYLKSQFLDNIQMEISTIQKGEPGITMEQVIERLKSKEPPIKESKIKEIRTMLWLTSDVDHFKEVAAIGQRIDRELARIAALPEEAPIEGAVQKGPVITGKGGSYLKQALQIPQDIFGQKR